MLSKIKRLDRYWFIIILFWIGAIALYSTHLSTQFTPSRVAFRIPGIDWPVYWYGVLIVSGIMLGAYAVSIEAERRGLDPDHVWGGLIWAIIAGVIGARLYHVLTPTPSMCESTGICSALDYFRQPARLFDLRSGGLGIFGAIVGALLGIFLYGRKYKIDWLAYADIGTFGLALGQTIGRWGNFANQELYGRPTDLPWAVFIEHPLRAYSEYSTFHPAFLYESLWNFLSFIILFTLATRLRNTLRRGDLLSVYLMLYPIGRILTETVRLDSPSLILGGVDTGVNIASAFAALVGLMALAFLIGRRLRNQPNLEDI